MRLQQIVMAGKAGLSLLALRYQEDAVFITPYNALLVLTVTVWFKLQQVM